MTRTTIIKVTDKKSHHVYTIKHSGTAEALKQYIRLISTFANLTFSTVTIPLSN